MALVIDATIGGAAANSYVILAELATYLDTRLHTSAVVTAASSDTRNRALYTATRLLDEQVEWEGDPADPDVQMLQWPRSDMADVLGNDLDTDVIPDQLKRATMELAIYLIDSDLTAAAGQGIQSVKVGELAVAFTSAQTRQPIPDAVWQMISQWGALRYKASGVVKLERA